MNFHGGYHGTDPKVVDFSVNIPPIEPPRGYRELMIRTMDQLNEYPSIEGDKVKRAIADYHGIEENQILVGNGAIELIYAAARSCSGKRVLLLTPTFNEYERAFEHAFCKVIKQVTFPKMSEKSWSKLLLETVEKNDIDVVVLCNPNNPTGDLIGGECLRETVIKTQNKKSVQWIFDESFMEFVDEDKLASCEKAIKDLLKEKKPILVLRSLTKAFALPGVRMGYGFGSYQWIHEIHQVKEPWTMNTFALDLIPFLLKDKSYLKELKRWTRHHREIMIEMLKPLELEGIKIFQGEANFILIHVPDVKSDQLINKLIQKKIYIRPCLDFEGLGEHFYRITVRPIQDIKKLMNALKEAL